MKVTAVAAYAALFMLQGNVLAQDEERPALPNQERALERALDEQQAEEEPVALDEVEVFGSRNPDNLPGLGTETPPPAESPQADGVQLGPDYSQQPTPPGDGVAPDSDLQEVDAAEVVRRPF